MPVEMPGNKQPSSVDESPATSQQANRREKIHKARQAASILAGEVFVCPKCNARQTLKSIKRDEKNHCSSCNELVLLIDSTSTENTVPNESNMSNRSVDESLDGFELLEKIGTGGFGDVWKAYDKRLGRIVAIKFPRAKISGSNRQRFEREAKLAAQLSHPNIVSVYELGERDGVTFIVSEFVEGITLDEWKSHPGLDVRDYARLCKRIADTVAHAHAQGVIHRDLKPENILIDLDDQPHVLDFGLAKDTFDEELLTVDGAVIGTPAYMSPEGARGYSNNVTSSTDIYSLGVILYELIAGELPFRGTREMLVHQILHDDPMPPHRLNHEVTGDLETICLRCLEKDPEQRFSNAGQLSDELGRFLDDVPIQSRRTGSFTRIARWCRRNQLISGLVAAVVATLLVGTAVATWFGISAARESATNKKLNYVFGMNIIQKLVEENKQSRAISMLNSFRPKPGEKDLRKFEWQYWWDECHQGILKTMDSPSGGDIRTIVFNAAENRIYWGGSSGFIHSGNSETLELLPDLGSLESPISSLTLTKDGKHIVSGTESGEVNVWSLVNGKSRQLGRLKGRVMEVAVTSDNRVIAVGGDYDQGQTKIWDWDGGQKPPLFATRDSTLHTRVVFSPDETLIGLCYYDGWISVVQAKDGKEVYQCGPSLGSSCAVAFLSNSRLAIGGIAPGTLRFFLKIVELETGKAIEFSRSIQGIHSLNASASGKFVTICSTRGAFYVFDTQKMKFLDKFGGASGRVLSNVFLNNKHVVTGGDDGHLRMWNVASSRTQTLGRFVYEFDSPLRWIEFTPDGTKLIAVHKNGTFNLVDISSKRITATRKNEESFFTTARGVGTCDHDIVLVRKIGPEQTTVSSWNTHTDSERKLVELEMSVRVMDFSPDGRHLALGGGEMTPWPGNPTPLVLVESATGKVVYKANGHIRTINEICFSPDGKQIATAGSDRTIRLWETKSGLLLKVWKPEKTDEHALYYPYGGIYFNADGSQLYAVYFNGIFVKMDVDCDKQEIIGSLDRRHIHWFGVTSDCETVISTDLDANVLTLLDVPTGRVRSEIPLLEGQRFVSIEKDRLAVGRNTSTGGSEIRILDVGSPVE